MRDPSTLLVAFVLPVVLLFLFAYAVSLDISTYANGVIGTLLKLSRVERAKELAERGLRALPALSKR